MFVGVRGIEPRLLDPQPSVLPLYDTPANEAGGYYHYTTPRIRILYYYTFVKKEKPYLQGQGLSFWLLHYL